MNPANNVIMSLDDTAPSPVFPTKINPVFSPNGKQIAFVSYRGNASTDLYVMDANGTNIRRLPPGPSTEFDPTWSPDGMYIAYSGLDVNGHPQLYIIKSDGTEAPVQVTNYAIVDRVNDVEHPSWSPISNKIAFSAIYGTVNQRRRILTFDVTKTATGWTASTPVLISDGITPGDPNVSIGDDLRPAWSPNANKIAFTRSYTATFCSPGGCNITNPYEIFVIDANGSNTKRLTNGIVENDGNFHDYATWSPDGTRIVYTYGFHTYGNPNSTNQIKIMNSSDGGSKSILSVNPGPIQLQGFEPDLTFVRDVAPEAIEFHDHAAQFGLPAPFTRLPIDDIARDTAFKKMQGYGPTTFAVGDNQYDKTHGIHDGIDYIGEEGEWHNEGVVAICDGIIIEGRNSLHGGSSTGGGGLSLRCFADGDTDNNGQRNLSNIVVVYNHLKGRQFTPPHSNPDHPTSFETVTAGLPLAKTSQYYTGCLNGTACSRDNLNTVCLVPTCNEIPDHLHFQIYVARGYENNSDAIAINPLLMFTHDLVGSQSILMSRFPYFPANYSLDTRGITLGELDRWSQRGGLPDTDPGSNSFYGIQIPATLGVEWRASGWDRDRLIPLNVVDVLLNYYRYSSIIQYIGPNCTNALVGQPLPATCTLDFDDAYLSPILP